MNYQILPIGGVWGGGMFSVPHAIADKYLKLASEYQLKALLYLLANGGVASSAEIAKKLGITRADAENIMDFWVAEGVLAQGTGDLSASAAEQAAMARPAASAVSEPVKNQAAESSAAEKNRKKKAAFEVSAPNLTPAEVQKIASEDSEIASLLNEAQVAFGHTLSFSETEMTVNLVSFYGMPPEVVLMLIAYCKNAKESGRRISPSYFYAIAKNWLEQGINTVAEAEKRLCEAENAGGFWQKLKQAGEFERKSPTEKQLEMIMTWRKDHSDELILHAASEMREAIDKPSLNYINTMLSRWKNAGISTVQQAKADSENYKKQKEGRASKQDAGKISRKPTYDLEKIKKNALNNTEIKAKY